MKSRRMLPSHIFARLDSEWAISPYPDEGGGEKMECGVVVKGIESVVGNLQGKGLPGGISKFWGVAGVKTSLI